MKIPRCASALGVAVTLFVGQEAAAQSPPPRAPSKSLPEVGAASSPTADAGVFRTSEEAAPAAEPASTSPLEELAWLVGEWVDADDRAIVETSVDWTKNHKFLRRMFRVTPKEGEPHSGMQLIGWDPAEKAIRSWTYDADGGFGEERWQRQGDRWTIRAKYTLPDGERGSATHLLRPTGPDAFTWRSVNRLIGGTPQPDVDEFTVVRKPAEPAPAAPEAAPAPAPAPEAAPAPPTAPAPAGEEPAPPAAPKPPTTPDEEARS